MGAHNPYDNFPEIHRGRSFSKDFERIDTLKMGDKILVEDARTGRVMYCYVNQLKEIDPEFGEYLKTASISEDGSTLTLTKSDGTQIVFHGGSGSAEGAVRYDVYQSLTSQQKETALFNIDGASAQQINILNDTIQDVNRSLSQRIDTIIQGRNVRDIVGNYDELLAYDTSTLGDNDIVMVLLDATKSGHTTYYRWKEAEGEWEFIGGLAFTYTKTEIDDKFAALHIVLPTIPADAVEHPEDYQELLAQVDSVVRSAGSDASFKMPVLVVDGISGNVDVTFVKSNPAHLYLGIFADDMSTLYHITRTTSTPRTYTLQIVEKVFQPKLTDTQLANINAVPDKADKSYVDSKHIVLEMELGEDSESGEIPILNAEELYKQIVDAPDGALFYVKFETFIVPVISKWQENDEISMTIISEGVAVCYIYLTKTTEAYIGHAKMTLLALQPDLDNKQDKDLMQSVITVSSTNYPSSKAVVDYAAKKSEVGDLSQLQTTDKTSIVNAINEVAQGGGGGGLDASLLGLMATSETLWKGKLTNGRYFARTAMPTITDVEEVYSFPANAVNISFGGATNLKRIYVDSWDTSRITSLSTFLMGCQMIVAIDLRNLDTSNNTQLNQTFRNCVNLESLDLSGWDASKITNVFWTFNGTSNLRTLIGGRQSLEEVVFNGLSLNIELNPCPLLDRYSLRAVINGLADLMGGDSKTCTMGATLKAKLTDEDIAIATAKNWIVA